MSGNAGTRPARAGYRAVLAVPGWRAWLRAAAPYRFTAAGVPLALVLLGGLAAGSFTLGGLMSGGYALANAAASPALGPWVAARAARRGSYGALAAGLFVRVLLLLGLTLGTAVAPPVLLITIAIAAGAAGAGVAGTLRTLVTGLADGPTLPPAMSLDTVLLGLAWTTAPVAVAGLAALEPRLTLAALAVSTLAAGLACLLLPKSATHHLAGPGRPRLRGLRPAAGSLLVGLTGGIAGGALDTAIPPRLVELGSPSTLAGVLFAGYAVVSAVAGLGYGARRWPGSPRRQAELCLATQAVILLVAALVPSLPVVIVAVCAAGACAAPVLTARSLALRQELPAEQRAAGFAGLEAVNGLGYGLAGFAVGLLLPAGAAPAFAVPVALVLSVTIVMLVVRPARV